MLLCIPQTYEECDDFVDCSTPTSRQVKERMPRFMPVTLNTDEVLRFCQSAPASRNEVMFIYPAPAFYPSLPFFSLYTPHLPALMLLFAHGRPFSANG